jgi:hypothetical protein
MKSYNSNKSFTKPDPKSAGRDNKFRKPIDPSPGLKKS